MKAKVSLRHVSKKFKDQSIFEDFNLEIFAGEMVALVGPSGCGKSTILNIIGTLDSHYDGEVLLNGENLHKSNKKALHFRSHYLGYLFQNFALIDDETVEKNLRIVTKDKVQMNRVLEAVGLPHSLNKYVYTLSGGQQQRVAMARLMLKKPDIVLADEPTGSLDEENGKKIIEILLQMKKENKTIIVVTHEKSILHYFDRVVELKSN